MKYSRKKQDTSITTIDNPPQPNPWEIRAEKIAKAVKEYMEKFKFGQLWKESQAGDWDLHLHRYVEEVATIQARMIYEDKIGFNSGILWGYTKIPTKQIVSEFMDEQRRLCTDGTIDVHIPNERIEYWKKHPVPRTPFFETLDISALARKFA